MKSQVCNDIHEAKCSSYRWCSQLIPFKYRKRAMECYQENFKVSLRHFQVTTQL
jgi:hypothetical protein